MSANGTAPEHAAERRIAEAMTRIERAAGGLQSHRNQLEQATRAALADLDRLIARADANG